MTKAQKEVYHERFVNRALKQEKEAKMKALIQKYRQILSELSDADLLRELNSPKKKHIKIFGQTPITYGDWKEIIYREVHSRYKEG